MKTIQDINLKIIEISRRISYLENEDSLSISANTRLRKTLLAELHTLKWVLGKEKNIDSDLKFNSKEEI